MKIRNSFVTNSSSSSFIISSNKDNNKIKLTIETNIKDFASHIINTKDKLIKYFKYNYDFNVNHKEDQESDPWLYSLYLELLSEIDEDKVVYIGWASNESDNLIEQFIYYHGFNKVEFSDGVKLINGDF